MTDFIQFCNSMLYDNNINSDYLSAYKTYFDSYSSYLTSKKYSINDIKKHRRNIIIDVYIEMNQNEYSNKLYDTYVNEIKDNYNKILSHNYIIEDNDIKEDDDDINQHYKMIENKYNYYGNMSNNINNDSESIYDDDYSEYNITTDSDEYISCYETYDDTDYFEEDVLNYSDDYSDDEY